MKTLSGDSLWTDTSSLVLTPLVLFIGLSINLKEAHLKFTVLKIVVSITESLFINGIKIGKKIKNKLLPNTVSGGSDYGKSSLLGAPLLPVKDPLPFSLSLLISIIETMLKLFLINKSTLSIELKDGLDLTL
jgi:hypothetical protein